MMHLVSVYIKDDCYERDLVNLYSLSPCCFPHLIPKIVIRLQGSHMLLFPAVFPREKQIDRDENGDLEQVEDS